MMDPIDVHLNDEDKQAEIVSRKILSLICPEDDTDTLNSDYTCCVCLKNWEDYIIT